jgi:hypothetical protein
MRKFWKQKTLPAKGGKLGGGRMLFNKRFPQREVCYAGVVRKLLAINNKFSHRIPFYRILPTKKTFLYRKKVALLPLLLKLYAMAWLMVTLGYENQ